MNDELYTVVVPGRCSIGPLPMTELRERLRRDPVPDDATLICHHRLGDQCRPIDRYPELCIGSLFPENSVVCPHCETAQPTCAPGERTCVRCGARLIISATFEVALGSDPKRLWYLSYPGLIGMLVFGKLYKSDIGLWSSIAEAFGILFYLMFRQGVFYGRTTKISAHDAPILYALMLATTGSISLLAVVLLAYDLLGGK